MANHFSRSLALLRKEKGLSQRVAAQALNISQALLSHYETGAREPGLDFVAKACDYYGVSADFLLGRTMVRDGSVIKAEELYDATGENGNRVGKLSFSAMMGKKMVGNAVSLIYELAGQSGSAPLVTEITNLFGNTAYTVYRLLYMKSGRHADATFPVSSAAFLPLALADQAQTQTRIEALFTQKEGAPSLPALDNDSLQQQYPQLVQSLLTLIHQSGDRCYQMTEGVKKK